MRYALRLTVRKPRIRLCIRWAEQCQSILPSSFFRIGASVASALPPEEPAWALPAASSNSVSISSRAPASANRRKVAPFHPVRMACPTGLRCRPCQSPASMRMVENTGALVPTHDRPLTRRSPAQFRQQRRVDIDDAERRDIDYRLRNNLPVADHHHDVGRQRVQVFDGFPGRRIRSGLITSGMQWRSAAASDWPRESSPVYGPTIPGDDFDAVACNQSLQRRERRISALPRRPLSAATSTPTPRLSAFLDLSIYQIRASAPGGLRKRMPFRWPI